VDENSVFRVRLKRKNKIASTRMNRNKYLDQKPQIRADPRNQRHPRSIRLDEYYFFNPFNHAKNSDDNPQISQINADILYLLIFI
jgi:hypothetical protein